MSQQIIEVLDYLFEKFGIAVDWTAENVMPYIQELAGKIVTYNIVTDAIWIGISIIALIGCSVYAGILYRSYKLCKTTEKCTLLWDTGFYFDKSRYVHTSDIGTPMSVVAACLAVAGILALCISSVELVRWICIPELQLIEYVNDFITYDLGRI